MSRQRSRGVWCRAIGAIVGTIVAAIAFAGMGVTAQADEIMDQINEAVELYQQGDYSGAASGLDFAAQQIRQLQAGRVSEALPAPLEGWEAHDPETSAMGAAFFGGGISAGRSYEKGDARIEIQILSDTPMLQGALMLLNNPMLVSSSGQKLTRVKGNKALVEYDKTDQSGEMSIVIMNTVLVTINGSSAALEDMTAYAEAIDYDLIKTLASGQ